MIYRFARVYYREIDYDQAEQQVFVEQNVPLLTEDQRQVFNCFCSMVDGDEGGTRGNIVDSCLKKSFLWDQVIVEHLRTNMRVHLHGNEVAGEFANQLLAIGDGKYLIYTSPDVIQLPENIGPFAYSIEELVSRFTL